MSRSNQDRINSYFRSELDSLRSSGRDFAEAYPSIASELALSSGISRDPHVEHLVQSFAWMMSRLRMQVESESKKIPSMLLEELAPEFVEARPPMTIAQCEVDSSGIESHEDLQLAEGQTFIPINLPVGNQGPHKLQSSRFSVAHKAQLWPFTVKNVLRNPERESQELSQRYKQSKTIIKITLESEAGANIGGLRFDQPVRFFINMEDAPRHKFYDLIATNVVGIAVSDSSGSITQTLDKASFKLCGFAEEERMFGLSSSQFLGTSVLQDFFAFPEKFMFFEISDLSTLNLLDYEVDGVIRLHINLILDELIPRSVELSSNSLKLNCIPLINLFDKTTEPTALTEKNYRYRLVPDRSLATDIEIQTIKDVFLVDKDGVEHRVKPYFSVQDPTLVESGIYWVAEKEETLRKDTSGCDVWISVFTQSDVNLKGMSLYAKTRCSNRCLGERLIAKQEMALIGSAPILSCRLLMRPTRYLAPEFNKDSLWKLMASVTRHHLAMSIPDSAKENLVLTLSLCTSDDDEKAHRILESIETVIAEEDYEPSKLGGWRGYQHGTKYSLTLNERLFEGSAMMFGRVVLHFLALYSHINSFSSLELFLGDRKLHKWPPMTGQKALA